MFWKPSEECSKRRDHGPCEMLIGQARHNLTVTTGLGQMEASGVPDESGLNRVVEMKS